MARARDGQLIAAFTVVLISGHGIESLDGAIRIERMPTGRFVVKIAGRDLGLITERDDIFEDAHGAISYYLDLCEPT